MLIKEKEKREYWQNRFSYIMIDEYQDINPRQYSIVKILSGKSGNLFVVGDDDQSIYRFRGSSPEIMLQFLRDYPHAEKVILNINYRCSGEIALQSSRMIEENRIRIKKQMMSGNPEQDGQVVFLGYEEKEQQYREIRSKISKLTVEEANHCAVLFRTNSQMQLFASILRHQKIPYRMKEKGKCIYDHFIVQDLNDYMKLILGDDSRKTFLKVMNKPYRKIPREALMHERVSFEEIRTYYREYYKKSEIAGYLLPLQEMEEGIVRIRKMKPYLGLKYLCHCMGYEGYLVRKSGKDRKKREEWFSVLDFICNEAKEFQSYREYLDYQEDFRETFSGNVNSGEVSGIQLMTVHASKGLEFERVWIPDLNEGTYPYGHLLDDMAVEEERRILYVGMTRAKKVWNLPMLQAQK